MVRNFISKFCAVMAIFSVVLLSLLITFNSSNVSLVIAAQALKVEKFSKNTLQVKLTAASGVKVGANGKFVGGPLEQTHALNALLDSAKRVKTAKLKQGTAKNTLQGKLDKALDSYYKVTFQNDVDMVALTRQLRALSIVDTVYADPLPAPAPTTPSFVSMQNYLKASPEGLDSAYAKTFPGGRGDNVKIYDLEYSWNTDHEDLSKARAALIPNGTPTDPFNDNNHGAATIGAIIGDDNGYGVTGAASGSTLKLINVKNMERGYDIIGALYLAAHTALPGDVILIEQQTWGPTPDTYDYVPVEWIPAVYDAISTFTASGIHVVEAAGNGNQNLDDTYYYGSSFPMGKPNSGAIIVGAGHNCAPASEYDTDIRRSRLGNSTYGSRVNLQGPGTCVTTTGYGDLYAGAGANSFYTSNRFNSTSAASSVVAAAVASLSSSYEALNGVALSPAQAISMLQQTGISQNLTASGALAGNIGAYPNLAKALLLTDKTGPAVPTNVKAVLNQYKQPVVSWSVSTDNVAVSGYRVYRNGILYKTVYGTSFTDTNVRKKKTYSYYVVAFDASGNSSASSVTAKVTIR